MAEIPQTENSNFPPNNLINPMNQAGATTSIPSAPVATPAPSAPINKVTAAVAPAQTPAGEQKPKEGKKKNILILVLAVVLLLLTAGGVAAYYFYCNSDGKIWSDAWQKVLAAESVGFVNKSATQNDMTSETQTFDVHASYNVTVEGTASYQAQEMKMNFQLNNNMDTFNILGDITGELKHTQNGDIFVQVSGIGDVIEKMGGSGLFDLSNVENQWIRIGAETIDEYVADVDLERQQLSECMQNNWQTIRTDKQVNQELLKAIADSNFVTFKRLDEQKIADKTAIGYDITFDQTKVRALADNIRTTQAWQMMTSCLPQTGELTTDDLETALTNVEVGQLDQAVPTPKISVWFDKKSHEPVRVAVEINYEDGKGFDATGSKMLVTSTISSITDLKLNAPANVQAPTEYKELEEMLTSILGAGFGLGAGDQTVKHEDISTTNMTGEVLDDFPTSYSLNACDKNYYPEEGYENRVSDISMPGTAEKMFTFGILDNCGTSLANYRIETVYDEAIDTLYVDLINDKTNTDNDCRCAVSGSVVVNDVDPATQIVVLNQKM